MPPTLVDLLWRDHPAAPGPSRRGPRRSASVTAVVEAALVLADRGGLAAVRVRDIAAALDLPTMSIYTYVGSHDDLLVLMVDAAHAAAHAPRPDGTGWPARVRRLAEANRALYRDRPWLLQVDDARVVVGPGTIAKYDRELHAFDGTALTDVERDAALTFVLDFVRASAARAQVGGNGPAPGFWADAAPRLGVYLAPETAPLAARVGAAAGEHQQAAYSTDHAFAFGLDRVLAGLAELVDDHRR